MKNSLVQRLIVAVLCLAMVCAYLPAGTAEWASEEGVIHGPLSTYTWDIPDSEGCGRLLANLYYHVGLWYSRERDDTLVIENCSMTNLEYLAEFSHPDIGTIRFDYLNVDPQARFLIFYSEDGEYEARVYLPSEASGVFVQYFAKDPAMQEKLEYGKVYEYNWREMLPDVLGPERWAEAWENDWYDADADASVLITNLGDNRISFEAAFENGAGIRGTAEVTDFETLRFETDDGKYSIELFLNAYNDGTLEMMVWPEDETRVPSDGMAENIARDFHFDAEVPPDLTRYGWMPDFGSGEDFEQVPAIVPLDGSAPDVTPPPPVTPPPEQASGDDGDAPEWGYLVEGPLSSWSGEVPDSDACRELLFSLYVHVGLWSEEGRPDTVAFLGNSMTGLDYTMVFDMPGLVNIEFDYVTVDPQARFITFYTSDGEYEARVYLPSFGSDVFVQVFARDEEMQRMLGRGYVYRYSTWSPRPDSLGEEYWHRAWEGEWTDDDNDAAVTIEDAGNNRIRIIARLAPGVEIEQYTTVTDYHFMTFSTDDGLYTIEMYIDPLNGAVMEFQIGSAADTWLGSGGASRLYLFTAEYPPDLTMYGCDFFGFREGFDFGLEPVIVPIDGETSEPAYQPQPVAVSRIRKRSSPLPASDRVRN